MLLEKLYSIILFLNILGILNVFCYENRFEDIQSKTISFKLVNPASSDYVTEIKANQFHIMQNVQVKLECISTFPIKIVFSGVMPNDIQYTHMEYDGTTNKHLVSIGFQSNPQATGPYSCVGTDKIQSDSVKSTIYIFADDGTSSPFFLHWKIEQITSLETVNEIKIPCITFRPKVRPKLHYISDTLHGTVVDVPDSIHYFDPSKGFLVNVSQQYFYTYECSMPTNSGSTHRIRFSVKISEAVFTVNPVTATRHDGLIFWSPKYYNVSVTCESQCPVKIVLTGYRPTGTTQVITESNQSPSRKSFFYKNSAKLDFMILGHTPLYNGTIVCQKTGANAQILLNRNISGGSPTNTPLQHCVNCGPLKYNPLNNLFHHCTNSKGTQFTTMLINCNNVANCEAAQRFDPSVADSTKLNYPYVSIKSGMIATSYGKQLLNIKPEYDCGMLQPPSPNEIAKFGIIIGLTSHAGRGESSFITLPYFVNLNSQIVVGLNYDKITDVLRFPMSSNVAEAYVKEIVNFVCEASVFIFAKGLKLSLAYRNGSKEYATDKFSQREYIDDSKIVLNKSVNISTKDIIGVECHAIKWNENVWNTVVHQIEVKESQAPEIIFEDDLVLHSESMVNVEFSPNETQKNITCKATGVPPPKIVWARKETLLTNNSSPLLHNASTSVGNDVVTSTITFEKMETWDEGYYVCIARSSIAETTVTFMVTVYNETRIINASDPTKQKWIFYLAGAVSFLILLSLLIIFLLWKKFKHQVVLTENELNTFIIGAPNGEHKDPDDIPYDDSYEIPKSDYEIDKTEILGSGAFGIVFKGRVYNNPVAVKSLKPGADKQYLKALLSELKILIFLNDHKYVVNLVGAATRNLQRGEVFIFVEYCSLGDLQTFLRESRSNFCPLPNNDINYYNIRNTRTNAELAEQGVPVTTNDLIIWSYQTSTALNHLRKNNIIHGDLATRNILLFNRGNIKLTDFGLSRKLYDYTEYVKKNQEPLPWRWMAIESLRDLTFSFQSDIWALGVTLWEIFSLAETPYPGLSWSDKFLDALKRSLRLPKPKYATPPIYKFMTECWHENPLERPKSYEAMHFFAELIKKCEPRGSYLDIIDHIHLEAQ